MPVWQVVVPDHRTRFCPALVAPATRYRKVRPVTVSVTFQCPSVSEVTEPADNRRNRRYGRGTVKRVVSWLSADPACGPFDVTVVGGAVELSAVVGAVIKPGQSEDVSNAIVRAVCALRP